MFWCKKRKEQKEVVELEMVPKNVPLHVGYQWYFAENEEDVKLGLLVTSSSHYGDSWLVARYQDNLSAIVDNLGKIGGITVIRQMRKKEKKKLSFFQKLVLKDGTEVRVEPLIEDGKNKYKVNKLCERVSIASVDEYGMLLGTPIKIVFNEEDLNEPG